MALSVTPRHVKTKLTIAREYFAQKDRCLYCDVLKQELRLGKRLVSENEHFVVFVPFASRFPFELLLFPKEHSSAFSHMSEAKINALSRILGEALRKLDQTLGGPPYNLSLDDRPLLRPRPGYWNTIEEDFHWHLEILPQITRITGFEWASGFFYNPVLPEVAARYLCSSASN